MLNLKHFIKSFIYAWQGIINVFRKGTHFKVMISTLICVILFGFIAGLSYIEFAIIILVSGLVLVCEMINTAFELLVDFVSSEKRPTIKQIKDIMAGASLIASIAALVTGIIIFAHHIF